MPLPPAPTKRAALLSSDAYDAPARSSSKKPTRKPAARAAHADAAEQPSLASSALRTDAPQASHPPTHPAHHQPC